MKKAILSLCDVSCFMVNDWVEAGHFAAVVDPQHGHTRFENGVLKIAGTVESSAHLIGQLLRKYDFGLICGFPPCTDVATSGSGSFYEKLKRDALVWAKAAIVAEQCRMVGKLSGAPWFFENPNSVFSSIFGKSSFSFNPYEYGGYLPEDDVNPLYPEYIKARDAYPKITRLWAGGGFELPDKIPVPVDEGYSKQYEKLGGSSMRTKNIRSATPRGFAKACFLKYSK